MGTLTDDMTRLRSEINAMREGRQAMQRDLTQTVATIKRNVADFQATFRRAHADMAKSSRKKRTVFVTGLSRQVTSLLRAVSDDLKGARQAWKG